MDVKADLAVAGGIGSETDSGGAGISGGAGGSAGSGDRRSRNPRGQGGQLRAELIAAADRILARTGDLDGLALRAVAREVGIATPSIYLHFPDKPALVRAVVEARFAELGGAVRAAVMAASGPAAQLRAGCLAYCRFATEHPNAYRVLFGRRPSSGTVPGGPGNRAAPADAPDSPPPSTRGAHGGDREAPQAAPPSPVADTRPSEAATGQPSNPLGLPTGAAAFGFLIEGVQRCMQAGVAPAGDPVRVAIGLWTALHGIVSLRGSAVTFPWPPLDQQIDDALAGLVGLHHNLPASAGPVCDA